MLLILGAAVATDWQTLQEKYAEQPFPSPHKVNAEGEAPPGQTNPTRLLFFAPVLRIFSSRPEGYGAFTLQGAGFCHKKIPASTLGGCGSYGVWRVS